MNFAVRRNARTEGRSGLLWSVCITALLYCAVAAFAQPAGSQSKKRPCSAGTHVQAEKAAEHLLT